MGNTPLSSQASLLLHFLSAAAGLLYSEGFPRQLVAAGLCWPGHAGCQAVEGWGFGNDGDVSLPTSRTDFFPVCPTLP